MAERDWEFLEHVTDGLLPVEQFEGDIHAIEDSVMVEIEADADLLDYSAEDCASLYSNWCKKYKHSHARPQLRLPDL